MNDEVMPFYFKASPGMDNNSEELELNGERVRLAQNCRFEPEPGGVTKRPPLAYYNGTEMGSSGGLLGAYRFYSATGARMITVRDSGVYVGDDGTGTMTSIRTLTTTTRRMAFLTYNNLMIAGNGIDPLFVYDGSSDNVTWELGSCKAKIGTSAGITATDISYMVQIVVTTGDLISGAISNTISSATDESIDLSYIPLGPAGDTTSRKIFRKDSLTSGYRLVATISNNTETTYTDTTADVSGNALIGTVTDEIPKGDILLIHRERLFIAGDPDNENKIYYSRPFLPHFIQQTSNLDYMEVSKDDGDKITGLRIQQGTMACWKQNNIRKVFVASSTSNADPESWYADDPFAHIGTPAKWSIAETPYGIIFLSWNGWYIYDGGAPKLIIPQFNIQSILPSLYNDVVGYFNKDVFYAAYSDKEAGAQHNNRILVYEFLQDKFSLDIVNANCFCSASGVDETGELYIGSSTAGYLYKAEEGDNVHRLAGKTQANLGTKTNVFVGGTESSPTIELGTSVDPSAIPDDTCIFWLEESRTPGSGWTEITNTGKLIYIGDTAGTEGGTAGHTHTATGTLGLSAATKANSGDSGTPSTPSDHTHSVSGTTDSAEALPNNFKVRIFKKNSTTTEYQFPIGTLIMWDQPDAPDGWLARFDLDACYPLLGTTDLGLADKNPAHYHTFSFSSGAGGASNDSDTGTLASQPSHTHLVHGDTNSYETSTWKPKSVQFRFIQKITEDLPWDGALKYCYALFYNSTAESNGWEDVTSTYTGRYIVAGDSPLTLADRSGYAHIHSSGTTTVDNNTQVSGNGGYHNTGLVPHTHPATLTFASTDLPDPPYLTFRLRRKVLGQMLAYNDALLNTYTTGTYLSPAVQINAETLKIMIVNISKGSTDTVVVYFRTGATKAACEAASFSTATENNAVVEATANVWIQYKFEFTSVDSTLSLPKLFTSDGYMMKFSYRRSGTIAETAVEFIYDTGNLNFDEPLMDKLFKKIVSEHSGEQGSVEITWETENATNTFQFDLSRFPKRWQSFFHSDAMGTTIKIRYYKNDLNDFMLKEFKGYLSPLPVII